jgi:peptidoglycan-associated lipoprotein
MSMQNALSTTLALAAIAFLATGCPGARRGGSTIKAEDLGAATAQQPQATGPATQGAGQGAVAGRTLPGGPSASGPGTDQGAGGAPPGAPAEPQVALGPTVETPAGLVQEVEALKDIYFEFDSAQLTDAARETLGVNASWMQRNPSVKILVEGHTDQRGSTAYNLALGERRAVATRDFLISLGVLRARLSTISYGKERPADPGNTETAWAKNRRAHFVAVGQPNQAQGAPQQSGAAASTQ